MSSRRWKAYRTEVNFGIGAANFFGRLRRANQIGTHFAKDLELSQTRLALTAGLRYKLSPYFALHPSISYGKVAGDDALTEEFFETTATLILNQIFGSKYHR
jgi:hypothetical protein